MVFRILTIIVFITSYIWIFKLIKKGDFSLKTLSNEFWNSLKDSWNNLLKFKSNSLSNNLKSIKSFVLLITLIELKIMAITGFLPIIFTGEHLSGVLLLIHVAVAPLISISFAVLVILFAHTNRFSESDIELTEGNENKKVNLNVSGKFKLLFWSIALFSIPAMLSIILGMFPLFGTEGQITLLDIHRYSVLIITILVILYVGLYTISSKEKLISNT